MSLHVVVRPRSTQSGKAALPIDLQSSQPLLALKQEIAKAWRLAPERQRLTVEGSKQVLEDDDKTLRECGLSGRATVLLKDLGPQIDWKTVFLLEYLGPLLIHPLFYYKAQTIYPFLLSFAPKFLGLQDGRNFEFSRAQSLAFALIMLHFLKRELEVFFSPSVHRFSKATMAFWRLFLNCGHYWGLSGLFLAVPLYGPWASARSVKGTLQDNDLFLAACLTLWVFGQLSNGYTHIQLRNLRPPGSKERKIPYGYGFNFVSCPNYFFEWLGWFAVLGITQSFATLVFASASVFITTKWALQRHRKYKKEFGKQYPRRKVIVPLLF